MSIEGTLHSQRHRLAGAAVLFMLWQAGESLVPVAIGAVVDRAIAPSDGRALIAWVLGLAGLFLVLSQSFRFAARLARTATERIEHLLRVELATTVLDPLVAADGARTGELLSLATSDAKRVAAGAGALARVGGAGVSVLVVAVALLRISLPLGALVLLAAPILLLGLHRLGGPLERRATAEQEHAAEAANLATDLILGLRVLKGIGGEPAAAARYRAASGRSLRATVRAARAEAIYTAGTLLLTMCFLAVVALVAGRFAAEGRISVGELVAAVGLAQFLLGPLAALSTVGATLARSRASARRVSALLARPRRTPGAVELPDPAGRLDVRCGAIRFAASAGELLAVVAGPAAASALVEVLATARDPGGGGPADVRVDGVPVDTLTPAAARTALLTARHDEPLFAESVLDNVGAPARDQARVWSALHAADADQVIATLPAGADTVLAEGGRSLSGGQRQRLTLARALAADPAVLVLHDPTTAVDAATEARIAENLRTARRGRTTVLVTTSPALLAVCDRVLVLDGDRVSGEGSHRTLVADAAYRELVLT